MLGVFYQTYKTMYFGSRISVAEFSNRLCSGSPKQPDIPTSTLTLVSSLTPLILEPMHAARLSILRSDGFTRCISVSSRMATPRGQNFDAPRQALLERITFPDLTLTSSVWCCADTSSRLEVTNDFVTSLESSPSFEATAIRSALFAEISVMLLPVAV